MIVRESGLKYAKLIHVSVENGKTKQSNKVYLMEELGDGTIKCIYGRVGGNMVTVFKQSHEWNKIYGQKTSARKGYVDKTDESVIKESKTSSGDSGMKDIAEADVQKLFDELMAYANKTIGASYKVTQDDVTQKQVDNAQIIIDELASLSKSSKRKSDKIQPINDKLIELYTTIPRKMKDVREHLVNDEDFTLEEIKDFISEEQSLLDTMAGQVVLLAQTATVDEDEEEKEVSDETLLTKMGLEVTVETDTKSIALVKKLMGNNVNQISKIYKCINKATQKKFDDHYASAKVQKRLLLFHGSKNENYINILQTGLLIRPAGVAHTGSMFGDGIYAASRSQKSIGYTSLSGSYWAGGGDNKAYLALFDFHLGNQKHIHSHDSSCYSLNYKGLQKDGYDSVYAHGGIDLRNDEFIVYNPPQCTIAYLIEITT